MKAAKLMIILILLSMWAAVLFRVYGMMGMSLESTQNDIETVIQNCANQIVLAILFTVPAIFAALMVFKIGLDR